MERGGCVPALHAPPRPSGSAERWSTAQVPAARSVGTWGARATSVPTQHRFGVKLAARVCRGRAVGITAPTRRLQTPVPVFCPHGHTQPLQREPQAGCGASGDTGAAATPRPGEGRGPAGVVSGR